MNCIVVEDDLDLRFRIVSKIEAMGIRVSGVDTIAAASALFRRHKFDVAVLDYYLPDGTSEDLANYIYLTQPDCRVILCTAGDRYYFGEFAEASPGIDWILHKPIHLNDLCALVSYAGQQARAEAAAAAQPRAAHHSLAV